MISFASSGCMLFSWFPPEACYFLGFLADTGEKAKGRKDLAVHSLVDLLLVRVQPGKEKRESTVTPHIFIPFLCKEKNMRERKIRQTVRSACGRGK
jgi:hypothetical protein